MLCVMMALFFAGCGKKDKKCQEACHKEQSGELLSSNQIDSTETSVVTDETADLFGDSTIADLAFVEDTDLDKELKIDEESFDLAAADLNNDVNEKDSGIEAVDFDALEMPLQTAAEENIAVPEIDFAEDDALEELSFKTVHFDLNKKNVKSEEKNLLEEDIELAKHAIEEGLDLVVQGHTCQLGQDSYNMTLAQQRAETIKSEMVKQGIPAERIKTVALGSEAPLVVSTAKDKSQKIKDLAPNRRVEISVS